VLGNSAFTYIILGIILVVGIYVLISRFIKKKKQKDNFNKFVKPSIKERLKLDGFANHTYVIVQRYHHTLSAQNKKGVVDVILDITNPKIGKSSTVKKGYSLMMIEVPMGKNEFIWEVEKIEPKAIEEIEKIIAERDDRKKHPFKYLKDDSKTYVKNVVGKVKTVKTKGISKNLKKKEKIKKEEINKAEEVIINDPFDAI